MTPTPAPAPAPAPAPGPADPQHHHSPCGPSCSGHQNGPAPEDPHSLHRQPELDPASRSLAEALQSSFRVLKWIMLTLLAAYACSGWFKVDSGSVALRLRFGALQGEPGQEILQPGGPYFALPAPLDEVLHISTAQRQVTLDQAFWFALQPGQELTPLDELRPKPGGLVPGQDGSLLTADGNLLHTRGIVTYRVEPSRAVEFVRCVSAGRSAKEMARFTDELVRSAAEQGLVHVAAQTTADDLLRADLKRSLAQRKIQEILDALDSGISVTQVLISQLTPPLAVRPAFKSVAQAESEKAQKIESARKARSKILNEAAGGAHGELLARIEAYEEARASANPEIARSAADRLTALNALLANEAGGRVAEILSEARTERTRMVETIRAEADTFSRILPRFQENPTLVRALLWQKARAEILANPTTEKLFVPDKGLLRVEINRDPKVQAEKEKSRFREKPTGKDSGEE